jgi:hypothetical protein
MTMNFRHLSTSTISLAACWLPSSVSAQTTNELKRMSLPELKIEVTTNLVADHHLECPSTGQVEFNPSMYVRVIWRTR